MAAFSLAALLSVMVAPLAAQDAVVVEPDRPALLVPLYAGSVALHALDLHSTKLALQACNREGNPLFKDASFAAMTGTKIAASAATVFLVEKLWKRNRAAAVGVMVVVNVGLTAVIANNYRLAQRARPGS